jgi:hypothetical protein
LVGGVDIRVKPRSPAPILGPALVERKITFKIRWPFDR